MAQSVEYCWSVFVWFIESCNFIIPNSFLCDVNSIIVLWIGKCTSGSTWRQVSPTFSCFWGESTCTGPLLSLNPTLYCLCVVCLFSVWLTQHSFVSVCTCVCVNTEYNHVWGFVTCNHLKICDLWFSQCEHHPLAHPITTLSSLGVPIISLLLWTSWAFSQFSP